MLRWIRSRIGMKLLISIVLILFLTIISMSYLATRLVASFGEFSTTTNESTIREQTYSFLSRITHEQSSRYEDAFQKIAGSSALLAKQAESLLDCRKVFGFAPISADAPLLVKQANGMFSNGPSVRTMAIYWGSATLSAGITEQLTCLTFIDPLLQEIKENNPEIHATYILTASGVRRHYPNINVAHKLPPPMEYDMRNSNYYILAGSIFNPERKTVWTNIYKDDFAQEVIITASTPLYSKSGELLGIAGIDLTLQSIVNDILDLRGAHEHAGLEHMVPFFVDKTGVIIAMPALYIQKLGLATEEIALLPQDSLFVYNLLDSSKEEVRAIGQEIISTNYYVSTVELEGKHYIISSHSMPSTGWRLGLVIPEASVLSSVYKTREQLNTTMSALSNRFSLVAVLFLLVAMALVITLIRNFVDPLKKLTQAALRVKEGDLKTRISLHRDDEIGILSGSFNEMVEGLHKARLIEEEHTKTLAKKVEERTQEINKKNVQLEEMLLQLEEEIDERERAEEEIKKHRDQLFEANKALKEEINEKIRFYNELSKTKGQLEKLVEISLDPIIITDSATAITKANNAFLTMIGYSEEEVISRKVREFSVTQEGVYESTSGEVITIGADYFEEIKEKRSKLYKEGRISNMLWYLLDRHSKIVPVMQSVIVLYNDKGELSALFGILRNITEQRKSEIALIKSKEKAEAANIAKSNFLANMSHEIRTPMNGVIGFVDLLIETQLDEVQQDYVRTIKQSGEALLAIINDVLDFSKIEAGKTDLEKINFDVEILAYDVCEIIRPKIADKHIEFLCRIGDNLPAEVNGDPHRFRQVLINLMGNASKFTETGEIELSLDIDKQAGDQVLLHTKVRDTGIGIPRDKIESIFDSFEQVDGSTTRRYGGTGLGLSITRKIANLMNGNVWVESRDGKGSTFHFTAWLQQSENRQRKQVVPVTLAGKKAFITDDNRTNLNILNHIMQHAGIDTTCAANGEEALRIIQKSVQSNQLFDICFIDIIMPGMNGYELAGRIRSLCPSLPLLALSSSAEGRANACEEAGFNGFLPKPVNRLKLFKMMERLLGEARDDGTSKEKASKLVTQHSLREDEKHAISILLAEDNPVNQKLAVKLLTKAGYRVDVANNGKEAVERFRTDPEKYNIILMDIQMPELNGLDAAMQLRQDGFTKIPIIALTANALKGDREKCLAAGMNDYISKPIKREVVFGVLKKWVLQDNAHVDCIVHTA